MTFITSPFSITLHESFKDGRTIFNRSKYMISSLESPFYILQKYLPKMFNTFHKFPTE